VNNLLPPIPEHLATLGMFDGPIGMATLGFIVGPDIVPHFPTDGLVEAEKLLGFVDEEELYALVEGIGEVAALEAQDFAGLFVPQRLTATVEEGHAGLEAVVMGDKMSADVVDGDDLEATIAEVDLEAELAEESLEALVTDDDDLTASVEEAPGEGRCK